MKKLLFPLSYVFMISILFSCSGEENPTTPDPEVEPEVPEVAVDSYQYLVLRNDGELYEMGNNTGEISGAGKIPEIEFNVVFNAIATSAEKIYIYEQEMDPFQGFIHIFDRETRTSVVRVINFPQEVFGENATLLGLEWDEENNNLIGIVKEEMEASGMFTSRIARIDPETMEVTSMDIQFDKAVISAVSLIDSKLLISTLKSSTVGTNEFFEIDLATGMLTELDIPEMAGPPVQFASRAGDSRIFGFLPLQGTNLMGASTPVLYDVETKEFIRLYPNELTSSRNFHIQSFYNPYNKEYVGLMGSGLFHYNPDSSNSKITPSNYENISTTSAIIDVKEL